jgi:hypothetical protein
MRPRQHFRKRPLRLFGLPGCDRAVERDGQFLVRGLLCKARKANPYDKRSYAKCVPHSFAHEHSKSAALASITRKRRVWQ